jgi:hypothetical protein
MKQTPKRARRRDEEHASAVFLTELATGLLLYAPGLILPFCVDWSGHILRSVTSACCFYGCVVHFQLFAQDDSTHADSAGPLAHPQTGRIGVRSRAQFTLTRHHQQRVGGSMVL